MREKKLNKTGLPRLGASGRLCIVYVSTFPPRKCGIATFTKDLTHAMDAMLAPGVTSRISAMNPGGGVASFRYPRKVIFQINQANPEEYVATAQRINQLDGVQLVSIQHEFGIFGGERGSHIIPFMQALKKPVVITFHTVLPDPDEELYSTVRLLAENASAVIVMTNLSKKILSHEYAVLQKKIKVAPHGIHSQPYTLSQQAKTTLGYSDRLVLSTFGLISRLKGLEYVIEALPQVVREFPDFVYIIFGATHPVVLAQEGESYRNFLVKKIYGLGLYDHVKMYNRYFPLSELLHFLKATDIYISPSLEPNQAVSGTLSYALGVGRPVISTAFAQAREVLTDEVGILVDFRSPDSYADAILRLLRDDERRLQLGRNAYFRTRNMIWPNVALQYARVFSEYAPSLAQISDQKRLPRTKLAHLIHLTNNFGIVQFAKLTKRDISFGYTLDDNASALAVAVLYYGKLGSPAESPSTAKEKRQLQRLINTYLSFIDFVAQPDGHFSNFVKANRTLDDILNRQVNLEEANARALYALALTSTTTSLSRSIRQKAFNLLQVESYLAYSNGVMPEALLLGYHTTGDERYLTVGKTALDFLIKESFVDGIFIPTGQSSWRHRGGRRYHFDQQPEETKSIVHALRAGYMVTGDEEYHRLMRQAFNWFLGDNSLNQVVYDRITGGCYDGVGRTAINLNQGAESTISYLLARLALD